MTTSATDDGRALRYVGRRTKRSDAPERLTGALRYVADLPVPGLLHARLVLLDYAVPKAAQSPEIDAVIVEVPSEQGVFGARGVGEPPVIPGPAAIANAVRAACGARVTDLPITPEKVQRALSAV